MSAETFVRIPATKERSDDSTNTHGENNSPDLEEAQVVGCRSKGACGTVVQYVITRKDDAAEQERNPIVGAYKYPSSRRERRHSKSAKRGRILLGAGKGGTLYQSEPMERVGGSAGLVLLGELSQQTTDKWADRSPQNWHCVVDANLSNPLARLVHLC